MTRHSRSSQDRTAGFDEPAPQQKEPLSLLRPLSQPRNLTQEIAERIADDIRSGRLAPGAKLPTEMALIKAMRVSRTVVREAVAALRSEGLVVTRQGSGAYVATDSRRIPFRLSGGDTETVTEVLATMELRLAVEVEAAAFAAERGSPEQFAAIRHAHEQFVIAVAEGSIAVQEDFALHLAIARASGNPRFPDFLSFIGRHLIPRQVVTGTMRTSAERKSYLERISLEHARIVEAILSRQTSEARRAMRVHLSKTLTRYRRLALSSEKTG